MSESDEEGDTGPAVELGDGSAVEGAPLARVISRLHYPIEKSDVDRREGETTVRTPDGPRELGDVLAETDEVYFPTDNDLRAAIEDVVGTGAVPTDGDDDAAPTAEAETEPEADTEGSDTDEEGDVSDDVTDADEESGDAEERSIDADDDGAEEESVDADGGDAGNDGDDE